MAGPVARAIDLKLDDPRSRVVVALDVPNGEEALRLADSLRPDLAWVKVGLQLFGAEGPDVVRRLRSLGFSVFLDLKLHDIPNTVARAVESLAALGVQLATVHAGGGRCVGAAVEAARAASERGPRGESLGILAVTVLTSHGEDDMKQLYDSPRTAAELVPRLAKAALADGAHGLVASPREVRALRERFGDAPLLVIPGIRPAGADLDDQARVATPGQAIADGADLLVIGRPITRAPAPRDALARVVDEIAGAV